MRIETEVDKIVELVVRETLLYIGINYPRPSKRDLEKITGIVKYKIENDITWTPCVEDSSPKT